MWRRLVDDGPVVQRSGWLTSSLLVSMRRILLLGLAIWQVPMVATVIAQPGPAMDLAALLAGHLLLLVGALAAAQERVPTAGVLAGAYVLFVADWVAVDHVDDPLLLAACWQMNLADSLPAFLLRGRAFVIGALAAIVAVPIAMVLLRPGFEGILPVSVVVTALAITVAVRIGLSFVYDVTATADAEEEAAAAAQLAAAVRRSASRRAAEDARILHDTAINTLAALANGAAAAGVEAVRERCRRDLRTIEALTDADELRTATRRRLHDGIDSTGITVRRTGLRGSELARREAALPPAVLDAVAGAVGELVRNAAKHADVDEVTVDVVDPGGELVVVVTDHGKGFELDAAIGHGLAESVLGRLAAVGVDVQIDAAPGRGTRATLRTTLGTSPPSEPDDGRLDDVVHALQRRAADMFAAGMVAVGVVLAVANHPGQVTEEYPMVAVVAVVCLLAWRCPAGWGTWVPPVLIAGAVAAFVLSAAAVGFGADGVVSWQAICPVGPLLLVLSRRLRIWLPVALVAYAGTVVVLAVGIGLHHRERGLSVLVAGAAGLGLVLGWRVFHRVLTRLGRSAVQEQQRAGAFRAEAAARDAALAARRRWRAAGLTAAAGTLREVVAGADLRSTSLRRACDEEEAYLRQVIMLHPDLVRMGEWFARALAQAREKRVLLTVRAGGTDVPEPEARRLGELAMAAVAAVPAGMRLTATLFPTSSGVRLTIVGPHPHLAAVAGRSRGSQGGPVPVQTLGDQDVIEIVVALDHQDDRGGIDVGSR